MTEPDDDGIEARAGREAADWGARLNSRSVSVSELEAFYRWRREPANADAYAAIEGVWVRARTLEGDGDIEAALSSIMARPARRRARWRGWGIGLGITLSAVFAAAVALWIYARPLVLETGVGEQRVVVLEDGSRIRLDTDSLVEVAFGRERRVRLSHGQAFFEVAKDHRRPFVVSTTGGGVLATGTRFAVRDTGGPVVVVLVEGSVRVSDTADRMAELRAGQTVSLSRGRLGPIGAADIDVATSWTSGRLVFRETPLAQAVVEVNRYTVIPIIAPAMPTGSMRVNGSFDTGNAEAFLAATSAVFDLAIDRHTPGSIRLVRTRGGETAKNISEAD